MRSAAALSDIGLVRTRNEDAFWCDPQRGIFIVADGIGGHKAGEIAAAMAVEIVSAELTLAVDRGLTDSQLADALHEAFAEANSEIYKKGQESEEHHGMACSLIAAVFQGEICTVAHAGDSRAYLFFGDSLSQITVDDTPVGAMIKRGYLLPEKARTHSLKSFLVKSVGNKRAVEANLSKFPVKQKERVLLCSDGLWGMLDHTKIREILQTLQDPEAACRELISAARKGGGQDNITVILVAQEDDPDQLSTAASTASATV